MRQLAIVFTDFILKKDVISTENYEIYVYGFQRFLELFLNITCSALIAYFLHMEVECLLFFLIFIPLRSYLGGFHLNTYYSCLFFSCFTLAAILSLVKYWTVGFELSIPLYLISATCMKLTGAVNHPNRPVDSEEDADFKKKANTTLAIHALLFLILLIIDSSRFLLLEALVYLLVFSTLIVGRFKYKNEEK